MIHMLAANDARTSDGVALTSVGGSDTQPAPRRLMGLRGAISTNVLNMIGIGPFVTMPLALSAMGGPQVLIGWALGALICLGDGLIWAELGSAIPRSGGSFHYLRETFGPQRLGRLFGVLYLYQVLLTGPISIASGTIGFASYAAYLWPSMNAAESKLIAIGICVLNTALLWRDIRAIAYLATCINVIVVSALIWIIFSGVANFDSKIAFSFPANAFALDHGFWMGLGAATLISVYDYGGYNNVCMLSGEVKCPERTIPLAVIWSIVIVVALYVGMNVAILGVIPWQEAERSHAVVSDFMEKIYGSGGGRAIALLILVASWGSTLVVLLGYSRVAYVAAVEGELFAPFGRLHSSRRIPALSLLFMGLGSGAACLCSLNDLIAALIVVQTLFQYTAQCAAVVMLRLQNKTNFRMPLYPVPVLLAFCGWIYILSTSRMIFLAIGLMMVVAGVSAFLVMARIQKQWPFENSMALGSCREFGKSRCER